MRKTSNDDDDGMGMYLDKLQFAMWNVMLKQIFRTVSVWYNYEKKAKSQRPHHSIQFLSSNFILLLLLVTEKFSEKSLTIKAREGSQKRRHARVQQGCRMD